ncbi:MAG: PEGA domain-containing protein [Betaproteobacteria bacterium]|nr:PEGA domain-containing protein [Betaproteobacteria bacterium]
MESSSRTLVCSILFLDIVEYSKKPVADQLQLKQAFNQALGKALEHVAARDRIILDTGDGAAVTFMGDPEDALFAAMAVRDAAALAATLPVRLGINLGPVRLVKDLNGQMNIIGDGINVAQRVMSFARPGQLLVSRSFYEVVSCLSRDYASLFQHEGSRTDKHVREHEVYSVGGSPARRAESAPETPEIRRVGTWLSGTGPLGLRRSTFIAAPLAFTALLGAGLAFAAFFSQEAAAPASQAADATATAPASRAERPRLANASELAKPAAEKPVERKKQLVERLEKKLQRVAVARSDAGATQPPAADLGRVVFAIYPWGEVLVDGKSQGVSPPVQMLELAPGPHNIIVRNGDYAPFSQRIVVKAGEPVRVQHRFN